MSNDCRNRRFCGGHLRLMRCAPPLLSLVLLLVCVSCEPPAKNERPRECAAGLTMCCPDAELECEDVNDTDDFDPPRGCVDTMSSSYHCGGCNLQCPSDAFAWVAEFPPTACHAGTCEPTLGHCLSLDTQPNCDLVCAASNQECRQQGCYGHTMVVFDSDNPDCNLDVGGAHLFDFPCDASPSAEYFGVGAHVACCCG